MSEIDQRLNRADAKDAADRFIECIPPYPDTGAGRGILIGAGGPDQFTGAWIAVKLLRFLGCSLPIQIWHWGPHEMDKKMRRLVAPLGVECIDAGALRKQQHARPLGSSEIKPYSLLCCRFAEALILDADCMPIADPTPLFDAPEYLQTGALLWPDRQEVNPAHEIWDLCGVPCPREPQLDGGQMLLDRRRCSPAISLYMWYSEHSDFFDRYLYGEEAAFHLALRRLSTPFALPEKRPDRVGQILFQYDPAGDLIFQHGKKWRLAQQDGVAELVHASECWSFREELRQLWNGKVSGPPAAETRPQRRRASERLRLWFSHGLGDCANFAFILELYRRRGYEIDLHYEPNKATVFAASGVRYISLESGDVQHVGYPESRDPELETMEQYWLYNKTATNLRCPPMPDIGSPESLWNELCGVRIDLLPTIQPDQWKVVRDFLAPLPRPIVLLHSQGNTSTDLKNVPPDAAIELYRQILDHMDGTLVLLDWDNRVPRLANWRVRHMADDWNCIDVATLVALYHQADLLISIDSGPLHLARFTDIPVVGLFPSLTKHPCRVSLPRDRSVCIVPREITHPYNLGTRLRFNIVESPGGHMELDPEFIAETCARALAGPRYLPASQIGADVQLQQFVLDWERGSENGLTSYIDRDRGFDTLLREIRSRFQDPRVVETGCIRGEEDWRGTGFGTYLMGAFLQRFGGSLASVDLNPDNCAFARHTTREMRCVTIVEDDSVAYLRQRTEPIDLLILDSMDTEVDGFEEHCLNEIQAGAPLLGRNSIVMFDDTVYSQRRFTGKGALAVPWLLDQGWRILHSGYQTICVR